MVTIKELVTNIYGRQKRSSVERGHEPPEYDFNYLLDYCISNEYFCKLYSVYINNGMNKDDVPTIDRINDEIGYTKTNIQVLSWKENRNKGAQSKRKKIVVLTDKLEFVKMFNSITEASKFVGVKRIKILNKELDIFSKNNNYICIYNNNYDNDFITKIKIKMDEIYNRIIVYDIDGNYIGVYNTIKETINGLNLGVSRLNFNSKDNCTGYMFFRSKDFSEDLVHKRLNDKSTHWLKTIIVFDKFGVLKYKFKNSLTASVFLNKKQRQISAACVRKSHFYDGMFYFYEKDYKLDLLLSLLKYRYREYVYDINNNKIITYNQYLKLENKNDYIPYYEYLITNYDVGINDEKRMKYEFYK